MCDLHCVATGLPVMVAAYQRVTVMHYKCGVLQYVLLASVIYIMLQHVCRELQHDQSPCTYRATLKSPDVLPSVAKDRHSHILAIHKQHLRTTLLPSLRMRSHGRVQALPPRSRTRYIAEKEPYISAEELTYRLRMVEIHIWAATSAPHTWHR